jgi:hypothetical protein
VTDHEITLSRSDRGPADDVLHSRPSHDPTYTPPPSPHPVNNVLKFTGNATTTTCV